MTPADAGYGFRRIAGYVGGRDPQLPPTAETA